MDIWHNITKSYLEKKRFNKKEKRRTAREGMGVHSVYRIYLYTIKIKQKYKSMVNPKLSCLTFMSFYCIKQVDNAIVFPSIKYVGNFPGKVI